MMNSLWISKTGMEAQQTQLDVIANNLANVSTCLLYTSPSPRD